MGQSIFLCLLVWLFPALMALAEEPGAIISVPVPGTKAEKPRPFSIRVADNKTEAGEAAKLTVTVRNTGSRPLTLTGSRDRRDEYRIVLFTEDGAILLGRELPSAQQEAENRLSRSRIGSLFSDLVPPNKSRTENVVFADTQQLPPGDYRFLVMRRRGLTWEAGCVVSNLAKLSVRGKPQ